MCYFESIQNHYISIRVWYIYIRYGLNGNFIDVIFVHFNDSLSQLMGYSVMKGAGKALKVRLTYSTVNQYTILQINMEN